MREILFRGKGINDKEWRYGFYTEQQGYPYITPDGVAMYEVDVDTVGQYTGFVDKNGKKIFEGDIVSMDGYDPKHYQILFFAGAFCLAHISNPPIYATDISYITHGGVNHAEIIGTMLVAEVSNWSKRAKADD